MPLDGPHRNKRQKRHREGEPSSTSDFDLNNTSGSTVTPAPAIAPTSSNLNSVAASGPSDAHDDTTATHLQQQQRLLDNITTLRADEHRLQDSVTALHDSVAAIQGQKDQLKDDITKLFGNLCFMMNANKMVADQGMLRWNYAHTRHQALKIDIQRRHIDQLQQQLTTLRSREVEHKAAEAEYQMEILEAYIRNERLQAELEEAKKEAGQQQLYAYCWWQAYAHQLQGQPNGRSKQDEKKDEEHIDKLQKHKKVDTE